MWVISFFLQENARNVLIKDHMRDHFVLKLVKSWFWIMVKLLIIINAQCMCTRGNYGSLSVRVCVTNLLVA